MTLLPKCIRDVINVLSALYMCVQQPNINNVKLTVYSWLPSSTPFLLSSYIRLMLYCIEKVDLSLNHKATR